MRIRPADPILDAGACAAIYAPFVRDTAVSFEEEPPSEAEMLRRITEISAGYPWLVSEVDGTVAGFAYASPHRQRAAYRWAVDVAIYVASDRRRQGLGRALYQSLFDLLSAQGLRIACAGITLPNPGSVALHESLGFQLVGVYRRIGWKQGAWHDVAWYQRPLIANGSDPPRDPQPPPSA